MKKKTKKKQTNNHNNPNPMGLSKAVLRGRLIAIQAYLKKEEKNEVNNLTLHLSY